MFMFLKHQNYSPINLFLEQLSMEFVISIFFCFRKYTIQILIKFQALFLLTVEFLL